jgi:hypothetical protein
MTANDPAVLYVEGFWAECQGHAWATVDGYLVDLVGEFLQWRDGENNGMYEPQEVFTADA